MDDFKPDPWQVHLMNAIDQRKTVIVSAPTSSGKTFASFYAIKTILKPNEETNDTTTKTNSSLKPHDAASRQRSRRNSEVKASDVVRSSSDDVVIYVAPTKALLNQMLAGVYARFKTFDLPKNKKLVGVFTPDQKENVFNSRVLLTVAECLEILLFSTNSRKVTPRKKFIHL